MNLVDKKKSVKRGHRRIEGKTGVAGSTTDSFNLLQAVGFKKRPTLR